MLTDKTVKVEQELYDLGMEVVTLVQKAKAGETPVQILGEELLKLVGLIKDVTALPADLAESFVGSSRAAALIGAELVAVLMNKDAVPL